MDFNFWLIDLLFKVIFVLDKIFLVELVLGKILLFLFFKFCFVMIEDFFGFFRVKNMGVIIVMFGRWVFLL